jgi:hypothetical protein
MLHRHRLHAELLLIVVAVGDGGGDGHIEEHAVDGEQAMASSKNCILTTSFP